MKKLIFLSLMGLIGLVSCNNSYKKYQEDKEQKQRQLRYDAETKLQNESYQMHHPIDSVKNILVTEFLNEQLNHHSKASQQIIDQINALLKSGVSNETDLASLKSLMEDLKKSKN